MRCRIRSGPSMPSRPSMNSQLAQVSPAQAWKVDSSGPTTTPPRNPSVGEPPVIQARAEAWRSPTQGLVEERPEEHETDQNAGGRGSAGKGAGHGPGLRAVAGSGRPGWMPRRNTDTGVPTRRKVNDHACQYLSRVSAMNGVRCACSISRGAGEYAAAKRPCRTAERHCGGRPVGAIRLGRCGPGCQLRAGRLRCVTKSVWGGGARGPVTAGLGGLARSLACDRDSGEAADRARRGFP